MSMSRFRIKTLNERLFNRPPAPLIANILHDIKKELKTFTLKPVSKFYFKFDPCHEQTQSIRWFMSIISRKAVRATNPMVKVKTEVVNDRSEPSITCVLSNKETCIVKTANLTQVELLQLFKKHVGTYEAEPPVIIKGI